MKKSILLLTMALGIAVIFSSCSTTSKSMREANTVVELYKDDFTLSEQVSATASSTKILGIDWARLFNAEVGTTTGGATLTIPTLADIPVLGNVISDRTASYALYQLMADNPGYDVVFYPQYTSVVERPIGIGFIYQKSTVTVTARLARFE